MFEFLEPAVCAAKEEILKQSAFNTRTKTFDVENVHFEFLHQADIKGLKLSESRLCVWSCGH